MENIEVKKEVKFKDLKTQKDYLRVLFANSISRFGDSVDAIAFIWLVYAITKSAAWSALIVALNYLPTIFIQPFAGTLVENMDKKKIIVITNFIRGIVVAALAVLFIFNLIIPAILVIFTLVISTVEAFAMPASTALIPKILEKEFYEYGIALSGSISTVIQLVGMASAGIIIGLFGVQTAIFIDAGTFFACGFLMIFVKNKENIIKKVKVTFKSVCTEMMEGMNYAIKKKPIRNFLIVAIILNALLVPLNALQVPFIVNILKQGSEMMSVLGIAMILGMGLGSVLFPFISKRVPILPRMVTGGIMIGSSYILFLSGAYLQFSTILVYVVTGIVAIILGFAVSIMNASVSILFMKQVDEKYFARVGALMGAMATAAMPITSFILSGFATSVSVDIIYLISGGLAILLFIFVGIRRLQFE